MKFISIYQVMLCKKIAMKYCWSSLSVTNLNRKYSTSIPLFDSSWNSYTIWACQLICSNQVHIYQILYIVEGILVLCPYWFIAMKWLFLTKQGPYMWNNQDIMSKNCFRWFDHVQPGAMNTPLQNSFFWFEQITWYVGQKE